MEILSKFDEFSEKAFVNIDACQKALGMSEAMCGKCKGARKDAITTMYQVLGTLSPGACVPPKLDTVARQLLDAKD